MNVTSHPVIHPAHLPTHCPWQFTFCVIVALKVWQASEWTCGLATGLLAVLWFISFYFQAREPKARITADGKLRAK